MYERVRSRLLRVLRVPHDPDPPMGAPGSLRIFRAGRNFYRLRLFGWGFGQISALVGVIISLGFLAGLERRVEDARFRRLPPARVTATKAAAPEAPLTPPAAGGTSMAEASGPDSTAGQPATPARRNRARGPAAVAERAPVWLFPVLNLVEWTGVILYLLQIPVTYALVRLDYEFRWYLVTDRSLRIRTGLMSVQESTMSFANVQQVSVSQGPLQRLLGIADVRVQSAGGGGGAKGESGLGDSLHTGVFHGVDNATEIRDLVLRRLKEFREAGLGDPEDVHATASVGAGDVAPKSAARAAALELLAEARALRASLG